MPSQDSIDIASIFDDIVVNNLKFCCICLRTEEERTLVHGDTNFMKCLNLMELWRASAPFPNVGDTTGFQNSAVTVCYVCEAESTRAYALFQAINFARIINQWFRDAASKIKFKADVPTHLDRHIAKQRAFCGVQPRAEWWRRARARCALVQTEVLVVGDPDEDNNTSVDQPRPPPRAEEADSIVIIDDDEDPLDIAPPPLTRAPVPPTPKPPAPIPPTPAPNVVPLHRLLDSNTSSNEVSMITSDLPEKCLSGYILQPLVLGSDGNYRLAGPTLGNCQVQNTQNQVQQNGLKFLEIEPLDLESDSILGEVFVGSDECINGVNISNVQTLSDGILVDKDGQEKRSVENGEKKKGEVEKRPVMTGSRIDWEDKIPMDVISFVDATDPLINKDSSTQTRPRKRHKDSVIDLS